MISKSPEKFWEYYEPYMGKGYFVFNEIILHGLSYFLLLSFSLDKQDNKSYCKSPQKLQYTC